MRLVGGPVFRALHAEYRKETAKWKGRTFGTSSKIGQELGICCRAEQKVSSAYSAFPHRIFIHNPATLDVERVRETQVRGREIGLGMDR